jgi:hypothetical protein
MHNLILKNVILKTGKICKEIEMTGRVILRSRRSALDSSAI